MIPHKKVNKFNIKFYMKGYTENESSSSFVRGDIGLHSIAKNEEKSVSMFKTVLLSQLAMKRALFTFSYSGLIKEVKV